MQNNYLTKVLGIQGFIVQKITIDQERHRSCVILDLDREEKEFVCSGCHQKVKEVIPYRQRVVWHLSWWQHISYLRFMQYRVICPSCGLKVEQLPFVQRYSRMTASLASLLYELPKVMTNKAVAILQGLDPTTIKAIDKTKLKEAQAKRCLDEISALGIDEIAVGKGENNYWHLVSALDGPRGWVLWICGRDLSILLRPIVRGLPSSTINSMC